MPGFHQEIVITPSIINIRGIILVLKYKEGSHFNKYKVLHWDSENLACL